MNDKSRRAAGVALIALGVVLLFAGILFTSWLLLYALPLLIVGIIVYFNKREDMIEQIKGR